MGSIMPVAYDSLSNPRHFRAGGVALRETVNGRLRPAAPRADWTEGRRSDTPDGVRFGTGSGSVGDHRGATTNPAEALLARCGQRVA